MFKPMLAVDVLESDVCIPVGVQIKLDGVRCCKLNGKALSRTLKPIPNNYIRRTIESLPIDNVEGELTLLDPTKGFNDVQSAVMSVEGEAPFLWNLFDVLDEPTMPYGKRYSKLVRCEMAIPVSTLWLNTKEQITQHFRNADLCAETMEGIILRCPYAPYKHGRSTIAEQGLMRYKPIRTSHATVVGFSEANTNIGEATRDEIGRLKRSKSIDNMAPKNELGALEVVWHGKHFWIGTGFTAKQRKQMWAERYSLIGKQVRFTYHPYHMLNVPTAASFAGYYQSPEEFFAINAHDPQ